MFRLAALVLLISVVAGCRRRGPNIALVGGGRVLHGDDGRGEAAETGWSGQATASAEYRSIEDDALVHVSGRYAIGGSSDGFAGQAVLAGGIGPTMDLDEPHYLGGRVGMRAHADATPFAGWSAFDLPTVEAGYVLRDDDVWHLEVLGHAAFSWAGVATSEDASRDYFVRPNLGGTVVAMGDFLTHEFRYAYLFHENDLHVIEWRACFAAIAAVCGDLLWMQTQFAGASRRPFSIGLTLGFGFATGKQ